MLWNLIKKIIKIHLLVIGLIALLCFVKKKHHCCGHNENE